MRRALYDLGLRIPEDITLVGVADERFESLLTPPIPIVRLGAYEMGSRAAHLMVSLLTGEVDLRDPLDIAVPMELRLPRRNGGR